MAVGDILKEALLVIEEFTVKSNEDIEKGEIVYNDGAGILAATTAAKGPYFVALEAHDYSEETIHKVRCGVSGCFEVQKATGTAIPKGRYAEISGTAGEITLFDYSAGVFSDIVAEAAEDAASGDTSAKIWLGKR